MEWMLRFFAGALYPQFTLEDRYKYLHRLEPVAVIDAKSAYDHVMKLGAPGGLKDKRSAVDQGGRRR